MSVAEAERAPSEVYEALEKYNWDDDVEFQAGLSAILGSNATPEQAAELTLRARCFYYSRKYEVNVDFDEYRAYHFANAPSQSTPTVTPANGVEATPATASTESAGGIMPTPSTADEPPVPYPTSFAHIVELIQTGQPIPGIKEIPNTVLTGQGTQPEKPKRRKPWEKDETPTTAGADGSTPT
ncbi:hypothetical protein M011DRAFT_408445 [Sporormia fimetaria CBS 119925]|uniref:Uncharacterized protein n=1 Tax=Sporormia fimetaria CBS 119925 TaxID=1340428 RepID=A0A6A6V3Q6_9PLEO|nr:hypothetical protein M011DRAFT_408445 [Sporormia fimetaria CBS 119925]